MLLLDRKTDEIITIITPSGKPIKIHLVETGHTRSKLGIDAPEDYLVLRDELIDEYTLGN